MPIHRLLANMTIPVLNPNSRFSLIDFYTCIISVVVIITAAILPKPFQVILTLKYEAVKKQVAGTVYTKQSKERFFL